MYWAHMAAQADSEESPNEPSSPRPWLIVMRLGDLLDRGNFLTHFTDELIDGSDYNHEMEVAAWSGVCLDEIPYISVMYWHPVSDIDVGSFRDKAREAHRLGTFEPCTIDTFSSGPYAASIAYRKPRDNSVAALALQLLAQESEI